MKPAPPITSTSHGASAGASGDGDGDCAHSSPVDPLRRRPRRRPRHRARWHRPHDPHHDGVLHHHILTDHATGEDDRPLDAAPGAHDRAAVDRAVATRDVVGSTSTPAGARRRRPRRRRRGRRRSTRRGGRGSPGATARVGRCRASSRPWPRRTGRRWRRRAQGTSRARPTRGVPAGTASSTIGSIT